MMQETILDIHDLTIAFDQEEVLKNVDLSIRRGEFFALVGESGSGKSITALAVMRLLPEEARVRGGRVTFRDSELLGLPEWRMRHIRGRKIAMIFQEPMTSLNPVISVGEQIAEVMIRHGQAGRRGARGRVTELLDSVGIPEPEARIDWFPHQLSGGQKQRIMIAMALACEPDFLIADEPTTALDVTIQAQVLELLKKIQRERDLTVLLITHDLAVVAETADRLAVLREGRILETQEAATFFARPEHPYSKLLLEAVPRPGVYRQPPATPRPLLDIRDLKVHFPIKKGLLQRQVGAIKAVDGVDLAIPEGETLALVGESGSGKSTVGRAVLRLLDVTAGTIRFGERDITTMGRGPMHRVRQELQIIFQDPYSSMNPRMLVNDIIREGMESLGVGESKADREERVVALLKQVGLVPEHRRRYPHEFSGGQRQRICIARVLAVSPRLIVCDEPTSALDVSVRAQILDLLGELQERLRLSYLFITHDLSVVSVLAHRVAVMQQGKIVEQGPVRTVLETPEHPYTRTLLAAVPRIP